MEFGHEQLDVYRVALEYAGWVLQLAPRLSDNHRHVKDQLMRASHSIVLNIAQGSGKTAESDRRRFFETARGLAFECAAAQDILEVSTALPAEDNTRMKAMLGRIVAMLTKLCRRGGTEWDDDDMTKVIQSSEECEDDAEPKQRGPTT
jgi:four helix bundle protein